jgi:hypothetical protein
MDVTALRKMLKRRTMLREYLTVTSLGDFIYFVTISSVIS